MVESGFKPPPVIEERPLKWFKFYTYVLIPLWILEELFVIIGSGDETFHPAGLLRIVLFAILLIGLLRRMSWAWGLNILVLCLMVWGTAEPFRVAFGFSAFLIAAAVSAIIWFLPNFIYFKKRRHLFT